jgi:hypothetical protein
VESADLCNELGLVTANKVEQQMWAILPPSLLHPGSLERFAQTVCKKAHADEIQLLLTMHSSEVVLAFLKASHDAGSSFAVFHPKLEDGQLDARRLEAETVNSLLNMSVDVRFLELYAWPQKDTHPERMRRRSRRPRLPCSP